MLISAEVEYQINPVVLDRYCFNHEQVCASEVSDVFVEFNARGICVVEAGNGEHYYRFYSEYDVPKVLMPSELEDWIYAAFSV